ncbi:hypothetical protein BVY03_01395 [bacterium K02(2017)]|nr:hypothetical protein BVY03_01395 [bacterium K02(2017)]
MGSSFAVSGLSSGLDTNAIVDSLVNVRTQQKIVPLQNQVLTLRAQQDAIQSVKSAAVAMSSSALSLNNVIDFEGRTSNSSDTDQISINTTSNNASEGTYDVSITSLSQADRNFFDGVLDKDAAQFGTGTFSITSSGSTMNVVIDSDNNTLEGIRDAINNEEGPVTASIISDGSALPYRLVLTANETGLDSDITQNISAVLTLTDDAALNADATNLGQDASVDINGMTVISDSNTISDAISGLSFTLLSDAGTNVTLTVSADYTSSYNSVASFISSYNNVAANLAQQFQVDSSSGQSVGILSGDLTLLNMQGTLNRLMVTVQSQLAGNAFKSLTEIGITSNEDGALVIDKNKFDEKLAEDKEGVRRLFQGMTSTVDGIADKTYDYIQTLINSADGILNEKNDIWQETIDDAVDQIDDWNERIDVYEQTLRSKFLFMEQTLLGLQQQSGALESSRSTLDNLNSQISG